MAKAPAHKWTFCARFRRHAFGWKSQPAIKRFKEAVSEIKKEARKDPLLAAEGAVRFLEKVSPAIEQVDSSSGAIGTAVNNAVAVLMEIIAATPADDGTRAKWLERLWEAYQDDDIPYLESPGDHWGELCTSPELASHWADELIGTCKMAWSPDPALRGYFKGTTNCPSALRAAGRHQELLDLGSPDERSRGPGRPGVERLGPDDANRAAHRRDRGLRRRRTTRPPRRPERRGRLPARG